MLGIAQRWLHWNYPANQIFKGIKDDLAKTDDREEFSAKR
jgi:hypothetical protein